MSETVDINELRERAKDQHYRLSVALHEAGHVFYAKKAGAIDIKYHGPEEYPGRPGVFGDAGVQPVFPTPGISSDLVTVARWYCAGSVVKRILAPSYWSDADDATDYDVFAKQYRGKLLRDANSGQRMPVSDADLEATWKQAQQDVERDLRSPAFKREMWALAREIEKKIPW